MIYKVKFIFIAFTGFYFHVTAQGTSSPTKFTAKYSFRQLYELDSLGNSNSIGKYFGNLYFTFLQSIEKQLAPANSTTKERVRRFEKIFAQFYIDACKAYECHQPIAIQEWQ